MRHFISHFTPTRRKKQDNEDSVKSPSESQHQKSGAETTAKPKSGPPSWPGTEAEEHNHFHNFLRAQQGLQFMKFQEEQAKLASISASDLCDFANLSSQLMSVSNMRHGVPSVVRATPNPWPTGSIGLFDGSPWMEKGTDKSEHPSRAGSLGKFAGKSELPSKHDSESFGEKIQEMAGNEVTVDSHGFEEEFPDGNIVFRVPKTDDQCGHCPNVVGWAFCTSNTKTLQGGWRKLYKYCVGVHKCPHCNFVERPRAP
jgi:hypothetical protein